MHQDRAAGLCVLVDYGECGIEETCGARRRAEYIEGEAADEQDARGGEEVDVVRRVFGDVFKGCGIPGEEEDEGWRLAMVTSG